MSADLRIIGNVGVRFYSPRRIARYVFGFYRAPSDSAAWEPGWVFILGFVALYGGKAKPPAP
jgi:hypothetical protein